MVSVTITLDDEACKAVVYALGAYVPNEHYKGWKKAVKALNDALAVAANPVVPQPAAQKRK